jgi:hypothetical protein
MVGEHTQKADEQIKLIAKMMATGNLQNAYDIHNQKRQESMANLTIIKNADTWLDRNI